MKIAYIMLTNGLEYDDRIRKEMFSMRELLGDVEFKIFGFHGDNHAESGVLSYGVPYELVSIKNRGGEKGIIDELRKEYDLYSQIKPKVKDYDLLWVCDDQPFFFPLFSNKPVIWDLHEIPASIIGSKFKNLLFHRMERRCKWLIHANQERVDYLIRSGVLIKPEKNLIIRNFPDQHWLSEGNTLTDKHKRFIEWCGDEEYIYVQGISGKDRFAWETLSAIMEAHTIKAVVIGNVPSDVKNKLNETYSDADNYIYYTGQVVQAETAYYMKHCKFSIVFYNIKTPNNRYCEPNRMFQCLGMGKPVIVGCNEPMTNIVEKYGNGLALKTEGRNISEVTDGICKMLHDYDTYRQNSEKVKGEFCWEAQKEVFAKCLRNWLQYPKELFYK